MTAASNPSNLDPSAAHLRVVADRGAPQTPGIRLSGVSRTPRSHDGDIPSLRPLIFILTTVSSLSWSGPSGCGKSTLLKMISGLLAPTTGEIFVEGEKVDKPHGNVGIVFQNALLLPWRNILNPRAECAAARRAVSPCTILMTPTTPAAAWVCPMLDLIDPSHSGRSPPPLAVGGQQRLRLDRVAEAGPSAMRLHRVDLAGRQPGVGQGGPDHPLL